MTVVASPEARAKYQAVIGLECHVELKTETKMFCGCVNEFGGEPNTHVCPVCLGMPGALPVPNKKAIELVIKAGLAFGAEIPAFSKFDRKNYFYPDMPKDYQISQYDMPVTQGGVVRFWLPDGTRGECRLTRIHLEEDTGKSTHAGSGDGRIAGSAYSLVDFNRAGVPLMECVSEPDIRSAEEAIAYLEALKRTFVELGVSDVKMEEGSLRCDANVSVRPVGSETLGTKTEIKNMNSFRACSGRSRARSLARSTRSSAVNASSRRHAAGTKAPERPTSCAARKRPTTIAISPTRTSRRSRSPRPTSTGCVRSCANCRTRASNATSPDSGCRSRRHRSSWTTPRCPSISTGPRRRRTIRRPARTTSWGSFHGSRTNRASRSRIRRYGPRRSPS